MPEDNLLDSLILAYPCPIKWDSMKGDERERFCKQCSMKVFNISDLSKSEAESFLQDNLKSETLCVKFFLRSDGTIKTNNCPRILRPVYDRLKWIQTGLSVASMFIVSLITGCSKSETMVQPLPMGRPHLSLAEKIKEKVLSPEAKSPEESKYLLNLQSTFKSRRVFDPEALSDLKKLYAANHQEERLFRVKLLQALVDTKSRAKECLLDSKLLLLEQDRQETINRLLSQAELLAAKKQYDEAWKSISESIDVAGCDPFYIADLTSIPDGTKKWKLVGSYGAVETIVTSEAFIHRVISLLQKLEPHVNQAALLKEQLESALKIAEYTAAVNEKGIADVFERTRKSAELAELVNCDVIALAKRDGVKKLSEVAFLEKYQINEFLKKSPTTLCDRFVEYKENYLTLKGPAETRAVSDDSTYLIFLTEPEISEDGLKHSKKYFHVEKNPSPDKIQTIRKALEKQIKQSAN